MPSVARLMHDWHVLGAVTSSHDMVSVLARRGQLVEINGLQALSYPVFFTARRRNYSCCRRRRLLQSAGDKMATKEPATSMASRLALQTVRIVTWMPLLDRCIRHLPRRWAFSEPVNREERGKHRCLGGIPDVAWYKRQERTSPHWETTATRQSPERTEKPQALHPRASRNYKRPEQGNDKLMSRSVL